jgi:hypothetical protein
MKAELRRCFPKEGLLCWQRPHEHADVPMWICRYVSMSDGVLNFAYPDNDELVAVNAGDWIVEYEIGYAAHFTNEEFDQTFTELQMGASPSRLSS